MVTMVHVVTVGGMVTMGTMVSVVTMVSVGIRGTLVLLVLRHL